MNKGKVYLVGAGPCDEGLITLKGMECVRNSDVIIYDELANSSLLSNARKSAELIYVGKKAGDHTLPQEEIGGLLIKRAGEGKTVCRLKGGDPFLFGRGGEEAELLAHNGIDFEIVPGVTSAIAGPEYAGIPITQRGLSSGVAIFTGHEDPKKETSDLNWKSIARLKTTLVFLMGMKNLPSIVDNLIRNGMDAATPVSIIHRATTPFQKVVTGKLMNIVEGVNKAGLTAPSIIVVGKVVEMRETLQWFEKKPLFGRQILVTRSRKQASRLVRCLRELGAAVQEFPTIEIEPNRDVFPELDASIKTLASYGWIIFTSANGVEIFFERIKFLGLDSRAMAGPKICAIGPATSDKLSEHGISADLVPEKYIAESILDALKDKVRGKKILVPRADIARDNLITGLVNEGAEVIAIAIYKTRPPSSASQASLNELLKNIDLVTFTSSSTVENFAKILDGDTTKIKAASIGPITTETIKKHGFECVSEAKEYTIPGLIDAICRYYLCHSCEGGRF